ncbi:hypothetical protein [Escherichia coli]|uniref:hypothetical protein n=1 Tax=Escherichia coli TaxID=562 RepID=UPI0007A5C5A8|nr:hypothetical protein [Escherichia coli]MCT9899696.1 hypothetical protein [Escherichia coli]MCX0621081.1 hypothetical protein [Escherichia coli]MDC6222046.1 hypothetical protein [Escherichia coli]
MDAGIASVVAAIIAAAAAGVGLVITKENKTSEFRQAWIDGLREELAELMENFLQLRTTPSEKLPEVAGKIYFLSAKVKLRLSSKNLTNEESQLLKIIEDYILKMDRSSNITDVVRQYFEYSSSVLKTEWERVKRGEKKYRVAITVSYSILVFLGLYFASRFIPAISEKILEIIEFLNYSLF